MGGDDAFRSYYIFIYYNEPISQLDWSTRGLDLVIADNLLAGEEEKKNISYSCLVYQPHFKSG